MQAEAIEAEALRRSDELKTSLLRSVSHDLRTPLTSIIAAGAALDSPSATAEERHELSEAVVEQGQRLSRLVENLLDVSRLETGHAEPHREPVDLPASCWRRRGDSIGARGEAVRLALDAELPALSADPTQLERAFANLLDNAVVHGEGQPVLVRSRLVGPRARGPRRRPGARASPRASASGSSSPSTAPARPPAATARASGLAIANGFIEANGGEIGVESLPGQGSSFVVSFPAPAEDGSGGLRAVEAERERPAPHPRLRRRAADPAGAEGDPPRRRLRGGHGEQRGGGARPRRRQTTRGGDPRPDAARHRRGRGDPAAARVEQDADRRPLRGRRGGPQGRGAGGRRRRLRDQALRPARAGRPARGGAAPRPAGGGRADDRRRGHRDRPRRPQRPPRRRGSPPDPDRVRAAAQRWPATAAG